MGNDESASVPLTIHLAVECASVPGAADPGLKVPLNTSPTSRTSEIVLVNTWPLGATNLPRVRLSAMNDEKPTYRG